MKQMILQVEDDRYAFLLELVKSLDCVKDIKVFNDGNKGQVVTDLVEAFNDVHLHEQGKKKLTKAKDLLNEL